MTDKRVEAAARAICRDVAGVKWEDAHEVVHGYLRRLAQAALAAADAEAWQPIEADVYRADEQTGYGEPVLLLLGSVWAGEIAHARWFEPWGIWHRVGEEISLEEANAPRTDLFGIGSDIPVKWCPLPAVKP